ncbi:DUF1631 family protein [Aquabacterium sp. OR-4]|uniref:DUF1631 family protein n=1 Tax=Aquabacterium sp. OR-4 TaxID=2978127 RepID=UPI0028C9C820|nr:DUF1631 family protein [Aquabacterium sp. OR-4]MDT7837345.1 DUF1631 family protein [Aquabacterium sp. OR-4]
MHRQPTLNDFIDDELLRAPMSFDRVIDAVLDRWRLRLPSHDRHDAQADRVLQQSRGDVVNTATRTLRRGTEPPAAATTSSPRATGAPRELALIGDDDVAVDIEIAHCVEAIRVRAEGELRELTTYTSGLVGDHNVARDTNPFGPEPYTRALWEGVRTLPLSRQAHAAFMREAAHPLAEALRLAYAGAVARLQEQGVEPAAHRTIIYSSSAWGARLPRYRPPADLSALQAPLSPASTGVPPRLPAEPPGAPESRGERGAPDLLTQLFEAVVQDPAMPPELPPLLLRLHPLADRLAVQDRSLLVLHEHALWRFIDTAVHQVAVATAAERPRMLGLARNLIDHLCAEEQTDPSRFAWATERLAASQRHALDQALAAAAPLIERLLRITREEAGPSTSTMPLDVGSLDTVPAELLEADPALAADSASGHLHQAVPGSHWRLYLQGDWRTLQLLWGDDGAGLWLLREPAADRPWALRASALDQLAREHLVQPLHMRSLVRRAASRMLGARH